MLPPEPAGAWPLIGHLPILGAQNTFARTLAAMADEYGPIYRIWIGVHSAIVVSSWEAVKECFTANDRAFAGTPQFQASISTFATTTQGLGWHLIGRIGARFASWCCLNSSPVAGSRHSSVSESPNWKSASESCFHLAGRPTAMLRRKCWVREHVQRRIENEKGDEQDFIDVMLSGMEDTIFYGYTRETVIKATIS
ncbi:hypothetical protein F0562_020981, partial [Nyssa sinensis]